MGKRRAILAEILADTDNNFLLIIGKLALNCSSNKDVFGHIKSLFDAVLQEKAFIDKNEKKKKFTDKKGKIKPYQKLDTSVAKLRNQMNGET